MRFVNDQGEALARQFADFRGDYREFLQRGDDDCLTGFECLFELARGGVDIFHNPQRLLELAHGALEGTIEHTTVRDNHDGIENAAVFYVVKRG